MLMDEDREMERFKKLAKAIAYEIDVDKDTESYICDLIADWAVDCESRNAIVLQVAASKEFNAQLSDYAISVARKMEIDLCAEFKIERSVLRYVFENSAHYPLTLYRASSYCHSNALESWTTEKEIAEFYISRNGGGEIIEQTTDRYLTTWTSGFGLECAREVVVIN